MSSSSRPPSCSIASPPLASATPYFAEAFEYLGAKIQADHLAWSPHSNTDPATSDPSLSRRANVVRAIARSSANEKAVRWVKHNITRLLNSGSTTVLGRGKRASTEPEPSSDNTRRSKKSSERQARLSANAILVLAIGLYVPYMIGIGIGDIMQNYQSNGGDGGVEMSITPTFLKRAMDRAIDRATGRTSFWESLDLKGPIQCGADKCLFQSANPNKNGGTDDDEGKMGYLVSKNFRPEHHFELESNMAWNLAQYLESAVDAKHTYIGPPFKETVYAMTSSDSFKNQTFKYRMSEPRFSSSHKSTMVQKVRIVPSPKITIKTFGNGKSGDLGDYLQAQLSKIYKRGDNINNALFINTLQVDVDRAMDIIEAVPLLALDFQIMIDKNGNIYHLDFDRVFVSGRTKSNGFVSNFAERYDNALASLRIIAEWASGQQGNLTDAPYHAKARDVRKGVAVVREHTRNNNGLSCEALEIVRKILSRKQKEEGKLYPMESWLMLVRLIEKIKFERGEEGTMVGKRDCTLTLFDRPPRRVRKAQQKTRRKKRGKK